MPYPIDNLKEVRLIRSLAYGLRPRHKDVVVAIGDDTAVVQGSGGKYLLWTADMLVEGVHFRKHEDAQKVGYKAMAVSVSDIAAMGGAPKHALVSIGLPEKNADTTIKRLFRGIKRCAGQFGVDVVGGDTNRSPHLVIDVSMTGEVEKKNLALRSTAQPGDHIFVSGPLGGSFSSGRHLCFTPRLREARFLVENFNVTSMMDLSDGLGVDLNRLIAASRVGALIFERKIPKSKGISKISSALFDGEDFELLFTLSPRDALRLAKISCAKNARLRFFDIGRITDLWKAVVMARLDGKMEKIGVEGFAHFAAGGGTPASPLTPGAA